jgi:glutathione S-transferase
LVLLEFFADLYPNSGLLSSDPVERAQTRFIIDLFSTKALPAFMGTLWRGEPPETVYNALLMLQEQLALHASPFLGGDKINIADAAIAPFIARLELQLKHDVGGFAEGQGPTIYNEIFKNERFLVFQKYAQALLERDTIKNSFPGVSNVFLSQAMGRC